MDINVCARELNTILTSQLLLLLRFRHRQLLHLWEIKGENQNEALRIQTLHYSHEQECSSLYLALW